ncbi:hypothetical protein DBR42_06050 [Pelomonas sp. HMWF004]|nr:hypothetical protein DBR42_06050 [Pelomonas sp. HMWF004]
MCAFYAAQRLRVDQQSIAIDLCFVIREDMMAAMLCEYCDCALRFAGDVKGPLELHDGPIHQLNSQLATRKIKPRPNFLQNIALGPSEMGREIGRPLGFELAR